MPYSKFSLEQVLDRFHLHLNAERFFPQAERTAPSAWLQETLDLGAVAGFSNEKEKSERIISPILLDLNRLFDQRLTIYSGRNLKVDVAQDLVGECDFILSFSAVKDVVQAPLFTLVEAKHEDLDSGMAQCAVQMVASRLFNERAGQPVDTIYGCATIGEVWRFLRLTGDTLWLDNDRYYLADLPRLLGALQTVVKRCEAVYGVRT